MNLNESPQSPEKGGNSSHPTADGNGQKHYRLPADDSETQGIFLMEIFPKCFLNFICGNAA